VNTHSPGPWAINWSIAGGGVHEDFPELHYVNIHSDKYMETAPEGLSIIGYIRPADALLIIAAPDLLAACKAALGAFERADAISWDDLQRAIAKAEGQL
jgi:hypothetical protein